MAEQVESLSTMPRVTHFRAECNALRGSDDIQAHRMAIRACSGCGNDFEITRSWQKHCSPRCRVRVHRQMAAVQGYYGA